VFWAGKRGLHSPEEWTAYLGKIASRVGQGEATQASLARRHDALQFFSALYLGLNEQDDIALRDRMLPAVRAALRSLQ
jgi:hypothetical protein